MRGLFVATVTAGSTWAGVSVCQFASQNDAKGHIKGLGKNVQGRARGVASAALYVVGSLLVIRVGIMRREQAFCGVFTV
jgi:hypothetical protein